MTDWKGQSRGTPFGYKIFIWILRYLGLGFAYFILIFVAFYFVIFSPASSKRKYRFFRNKIGLGRVKSIFKIYHNYYVFGQVLLDKIAALSGMDNEFTYSVENRDSFIDFSKQNKGGMVISAHVGNWELAGNFLNTFRTKANILMLDQEHSYIRDILEETMTKKNINIIPLKNDGSHVFHIHKVLKQGEIICTHGDRHMEGIKTIKANFMGELALFPQGPFFLAKRFNVPCIFLFTIKEKNKHYRIFPSVVQDPSKTLEETVQSFANHMEEILRKYPEQWFNFHDFWKMPDDAN